MNTAPEHPSVSLYSLDRHIGPHSKKFLMKTIDQQLPTSSDSLGMDDKTASAEPPSTTEKSPNVNNSASSIDNTRPSEHQKASDSICEISRVFMPDKAPRLPRPPTIIRDDLGSMTMTSIGESEVEFYSRQTQRFPPAPPLPRPPTIIRTSKLWDAEPPMEPKRVKEAVLNAQDTAPIPQSSQHIAPASPQAPASEEASSGSTAAESYEQNSFDTIDISTNPDEATVQTSSSDPEKEEHSSRLPYIPLSLPLYAEMRQASKTCHSSKEKNEHEVRRKRLKGYLVGGILGLFLFPLGLLIFMINTILARNPIFNRGIVIGSVLAVLLYILVFIIVTADS